MKEKNKWSVSGNNDDKREVIYYLKLVRIIK